MLKLIKLFIAVLKLILAVVIVSFAIFAGISSLSGDMSTVLDGFLNPSSSLVIQQSIKPSFLIQYFHWTTSILKGDFGYSESFSQDIFSLIKERGLLTLSLGLWSLFISIIIGMTLGIVQTIASNNLKRFVGRLSIFLIALPSSWLGLVFIYFFAIELKLFPSSGINTISSYVLPSLTLGLALGGISGRYIFTLLSEVMCNDFIHFAQIKGMSKTRVVFKYAIPYASPSLFAMLGLQINFLITGVLVIEKIFSIPAIGDLLLTSIYHRDLSTASFVAMALVIFIIIVNSLISILSINLNPLLKRDYNA